MDTEIEQIADEISDEYGQAIEFKNRFLKFYQNTMENNVGDTDLEKLIELVELPEEEELDGS